MIILPPKCMLSVCIWGSQMSQHIINHSFRGIDSFLVKWNGLTGKGVKKGRKLIMGLVLYLSKCTWNLYSLWWVAIITKNVVVDPVKADTLFLQEENTRNSHF